MSDELKETKKELLNEIDQLCDATDQMLEEWQGEGNLQFPKLLLDMAVRFNWDDKTMRENDPIVRKYVRKHPKWHVTRGAHGGIMRRSDKDKKEADKAAKDLLKNQMKKDIEAKVAATSANSDTE